MRIFADCADFTVMESLENHVDGFTTNPTLMRAAGVTDYESFVKRCAKRFPHHSLSFEVIADVVSEMIDQAHTLASWDSEIHVKIPITLTDGTSTQNVIRDLSRDHINVNVTAVFTKAQARRAAIALIDAQSSYISIFAGRISDTGVDPVDIVDSTVSFVDQFARVGTKTEVLWASTREVFNIIQAEAAGAHIITMTPDLINKTYLLGKDLDEFSRETVQMFYRDAQEAGLKL